MNISDRRQQPTRQRVNPQAVEKQEPEPKPDLYIVKMEPTGGRAREDFYFDVTVRNRGEVAAGDFDVQVKGFGVKDDTARLEGGLEPKKRATVRVGPVRVNIPGRVHYRGKVDSSEEVDESREGNNRAYKEMYIFDPWGAKE